MADEGDVDQQQRTRYLEERRQYIDAARESARTFDKAVLTFGSAVFGFSIAFVKDIAPTPIPDTLRWLEGAWLLFALGLLAILLSFLFSHQACMFEIGACEEALASTGSVGGRKKNPWSITTTCCNYLCIAFLFFGLLCWSKFAIRNISEGEQSMSKGESGFVKKGYVPPPSPPKAPSQQQPTAPPPPPPPPPKK